MVSTMLRKLILFLIIVTGVYLGFGLIVKLLFSMKFLGLILIAIVIFKLISLKK
ncbi:hypothetical protein D1872_36750 [compost metagenome]|jgi:hypothetical protein